MNAGERFALAVLVGFVLGLCGVAVARADAPGPSPYQQRPDIFPCNGCNMQLLNPTTVKVKQTRAASYRLITMPGCNTGSIPQDLDNASADFAASYGMTLTRNDAAYDFTIRINCGLGQISICGAVNVFCLGRGFPGVTDIDLSDILSSWQPGTQLGVPEHELSHALGSWNEQYALCGASCGFQATPGLESYMNTGPLSWHGVEADDCGRWWRTMWQPPCAATYFPASVDCATQGWDACTGRWYAPDGWSYNPADGSWWNPDGQREWSACDFSWRGRYNYLGDFWVSEGTPVFRGGGWRIAPAC